MGQYIPKELISKVCTFVFFKKQLYVLMYCLYFLFTNNYSKYHEILRYDHDMYVMKYVCMLRIYISQVSTMSAQNRYIYKVQY